MLFCYIMILCKSACGNFWFTNGFFHLSEELHYHMMAKSGGELFCTGVLELNWGTLVIKTSSSSALLIG